jgi:tRNA pseudouridine55 synthase
MGYVKRKYATKKVGFSGTLDPFATGCLIVATGQYTKLFQYLKKTPKTYRATLWLGASSPTLDIEKIDTVEEIAPLPLVKVQETLQSFQGELSYLPPRYSAKKIEGKRAYALARNGEEVTLKKVDSTIHTITLLHYTHPFIHFESTVSEGTYIRSLGQLIAEKLGVNGTLSSLERLCEGEFHYDYEKALDPLDYLSIEKNNYTGDPSWLELGKKLSIDYFENKADGLYYVVTGNFFSIIEIDDGKVSYKLNRQEKFHADN